MAPSGNFDITLETTDCVYELTFTLFAEPSVCLKMEYGGDRVEDACVHRTDEVLEALNTHLWSTEEPLVWNISEINPSSIDSYLTKLKELMIKLGPNAGTSLNLEELDSEIVTQILKVCQPLQLVNLQVSQCKGPNPLDIYSIFESHEKLCEIWFKHVRFSYDMRDQNKTFLEMKRILLLNCASSSAERNVAHMLRQCPELVTLDCEAVRSRKTEAGQKVLEEEYFKRMWQVRDMFFSYTTGGVPRVVYDTRDQAHKKKLRFCAEEDKMNFEHR